MASWRQDLIYSFRRLTKTPGFVLAVIVSLGLGIAANATIFSMVTKFILSPAPVGNPSTLLALYTTYDHGDCCNNFSLPLAQDIQSQMKSFSGVAWYYDLIPASIGGAGNAERVWGQAATANFFDVAQTRMTIGRGFLPSEEREPVVVLGYDLWRQRFAGDSNVLGKSVVLSGHPYTVVGVAPRNFRGLALILDPQFWVSFGNVDQLVLGLPDHTARNYNWVRPIGRLRPGVTRIQADAELATLARNLAKAYPATDKDLGFRTNLAGSIGPRDESLLKGFLAGLMVVVLLVLAIACANVANLLLAQTTSRQREVAIRLALGATRATVLRQMLLESVVLSVGGGLFGVALSLWATSALSSFRPPAPIPLDMAISVDWHVLLYSFLLSVVTGVLFGVVPAWIASRPMLTRALKGEDALSRPGRRFTLRNILVVAQISISLILLCATGLFLRSMERAASINIGFRSHGVLMMSVDPRIHGYSPERTVAFLSQLRERVATLPGVVSAVTTDTVPLSGGNRSDAMEAVGTKGNAPNVELYMATPGYFQTMGIPLIAGRDFSHESPTGEKVVVIDEVLARKLFGNANPLGHQIRGAGITYQVIGLVKNIKSRTIGEETRPVLFRSLEQTVASDPAMMGYTLVIRTAGDSASIATAVRREIASLDPAMAVYNVATMEEHLKDALFLPHLTGTLFTVFGLTGLILAAVGLYGVMSYSVSRRTREIGIRIAVGAQLHAVQRLFVRQGMILTLIAVAIGLPAAYALAKFSTSLLYGVEPHDLVTFLSVPIFLAGIALFACWIPARRASKVDPLVTLRYE